jgi:hypothetical protein
MALATGAIGTLLPVLHELSKEEHSLPRSATRKVMSIIAGLEEIQSTLHRVWSEKPRDKLDEQDMLWDKQAVDLARHIGDLTDKFRVSFSGARQSRRTAAAPGPGDLIAKINSKPKARRKFASDISNASRLVQEAVGRHGRYRIDSAVLPPGQLADRLHADELRAPAVELPSRDDLQKLRLPSWVQADVGCLKAELEFVNVVFRMLAPVPADELDEGTRAWAEDLREVALDIKLAAGKFNSATNPQARRRFAVEIWEMKHSLLEAAERRQRYDLSNLLGVLKRSADNNADAHHSGSVGARVDPVSLVAIEGHRDFLVKLLEDEASTSDQQRLRMASIVGLAGVGKTTLAREVQRIMKPHFECIACVSLPTLPEPDMEPVLRDLLRQISKPPGSHGAPQATCGQPAAGSLMATDAHQHGAPSHATDKGLIDEICHTLKDKRYYILLHRH